MQVQSVVPDQLLLQMLVNWLGPLNQEKETPVREPERKKQALKISTETEKAGPEKETQRPPLKVQSASQISCTPIVPMISECLFDDSHTWLIL